MNPLQLARRALAGADVHAPTDAQVTRCIALAAFALAQNARGEGTPFADGDNEWTRAAAQLADDEAGKE